MSDEVEVIDEQTGRRSTGRTPRGQAYGGRDPQSVDEVRATDDEFYAPQGPGDIGYEAPLIVPELDLEGGTKFVVGEDEYESLADAQEALAPEVEEPVDGDQAELTPADEP